eukprot:1989931-Pyramimonas_sp.AAC.1
MAAGRSGRVGRGGERACHGGQRGGRKRRTSSNCARRANRASAGGSAGRITYLPPAFPRCEHALMRALNDNSKHVLQELMGRLYLPIE